MFVDSLRKALTVLAPVDCAGCGEDGRRLCSSCGALLLPLVTPRTIEGRLTHTALRYEDVVRRVVLAFKEEGRTDIARDLARPFAAAINAARAQARDALVVPVPGSAAAFRRRGYDPVLVLLRRAGIPATRGLRRHRRAAEQKQLGLQDRSRNVADTMVGHPRLAGRTIVLVDDVVTTGATLAEAVRAAESAGARVVGIATMAFTPRLLWSRDMGVT